jgi:hypothetical protein
MSKTLDQIFIGNPITSNAPTDLMYFVQSPYTVGTDAGMTFANFSAQFGLSGGVINPAHGGTGINNGTNTLTIGANSVINQDVSTTGSPTFAALTLTAPLPVTSGGTGLATTVNNGVFITGATGIPAWLANSATPGFVLTANAGAPPSWQSITTEGAITTIDGDSGSASPAAGVLTISGGTTGLTTSGSVSTLSLTGTLKLVNGGTNASLTASNGGIVWSNATQMQILAGTATAGQILISGASATPSWLAAGGGGTLVRSVGTAWAASTTTLANSFSINTIVYAASANNLSGLATVNSASLSTTSTGVPTWLALTNGQIVIGSTGASPAAATLTAGTGISIANAANSITISSSGADIWVDETGASVTMATNTGYTSDDGATLVTFTLPTTSAIGDWVEINGKGAGLWKIAQAAGQQIHIGTVATTSGVGGSLASVNQFDNVRLRCLTANTIWTVVSQQSSGLTVV